MTLIRLTQADPDNPEHPEVWIRTEAVWSFRRCAPACCEYGTVIVAGIGGSGGVVASTHVTESPDEVAELIRQATAQTASTTPDYASAHSWLNGFLEALATPGLEPMVSSAPEGVIVFEWRRPPYRIGAEIGQGAIEMYRVNTETEGPAEFATVGIGETTWDEIVAFVKGAES